MKYLQLQYVFFTYPCTHHLFVSSFLQGAHSNTAVRNHYYNTDTLIKAQSVFAPRSTVTTNSGSATSSSTRLYGFLNPFSRSSNNDDNNNDDDENDDNDDVVNHQLDNISSSELEKARSQFEDMFTIPNDNLTKKERKEALDQKKASMFTSSFTSSVSPSAAAVDESNTNNSNNNNNNNSDDLVDENNNDVTNNPDQSLISNNDKEKRRLLTKTRDITRIAQEIPPSPLTAIGKERRLQEIKLLSTLTQSDEAVNELWSLWIAERGPTSATLLLRAEQLMSIESYDEAETLLWKLIYQYGVHWAEPLNRLATLKYMQGSLEESKKLCETVLQVKPWHFGALSGIVLVCTAMNDATGARLWADRRLPPLIPDHTSGDRRVKWISRALEDAKDRLTIASKVGRSSKIGVEETEFRTFRARMQHLNMDHDISSSGGIVAGEGDDTNSSLSSSSTLSWPNDNNLDAWQ